MLAREEKRSSAQTEGVCCIFRDQAKPLLRMQPPSVLAHPANVFSQLPDLRNHFLKMFHDQQNGFPAGTFITWIFSTDQGYFEPPSAVSCRSLLGCNTPRDLLPVESESKGYKHDKAKIYKGIKPFWEENEAVKSRSPYLELGRGPR